MRRSVFHSYDATFIRVSNKIILLQHLTGEHSLTKLEVMHLRGSTLTAYDNINCENIGREYILVRKERTINCFNRHLTVFILHFLQLISGLMLLEKKIENRSCPRVYRFITTLCDLFMKEVRNKDFSVLLQLRIVYHIYIDLLEIVKRGYATSGSVTLPLCQVSIIFFSKPCKGKALLKTVECVSLNVI